MRAHLVFTIIFPAIILCSLNLSAETPESIQLVGNFNGITCHPDDPANDMTKLEEHEWVKLKYIDEEGSSPDTISFKFTRDHDYYPEHWGWSFVYGWGIADLSFSPPSIVAVLPDSGFYYFHFNDSTNAYYLDRPQAKIYGSLVSDVFGETPPGARIDLLDSDYAKICECTGFCENGFCFSNLPEATYSLYASAPGYSDTTITGLSLPAGDSLQVSITLYKNTAVLISTVSCERAEGEIIINWSTGSDCQGVGFDVYRGEYPELRLAEKRNLDPIYYTSGYSFLDRDFDKYKDYYYYIVEYGDPNGTVYGPIETSGMAPGASSFLGQNYPNPFNPSTTIPYFVGEGAEGAPVSISFFDVSGRLIRRYDLGKKPAGDYSFNWNPSASTGDGIPSGVYYCRLSVGKEVYSRKMVLLR